MQPDHLEPGAIGASGMFGGVYGATDGLFGPGELGACGP